jgi:catechol 2,3-dioxygenase-like lactoylglutathione lyase family enzyme
MDFPLSRARITTFLPVIDVQRARSFYEGKLGFAAPEATGPDGTLMYHLQDGTVALRPMEGGTKAEHTALSFQVPDIEEGVRSLERAGVRFEDYDSPELRTVNHICTIGHEKCAWFRDTEGNFLCLHQDLH